MSQTAMAFTKAFCTVTPRVINNIVQMSNSGIDG